MAHPTEFINTGAPTFSLAQVENLPRLWEFINKWRQRRVVVYWHPSKADRVLTIGWPYDNSRAIICDEPIECYHKMIIRGQRVVE